MSLKRCFKCKSLVDRIAALEKALDESQGIVTIVGDDLRQLRMDRALTDREWREALHCLEKRVTASRAARGPQK